MKSREMEYLLDGSGVDAADFGKIGKQTPDHLSGSLYRGDPAAAGRPRGAGSGAAVGSEHSGDGGHRPDLQAAVGLHIITS